jgi:flagellar motor component MotA
MKRSEFEKAYLAIVKLADEWSKHSRDKGILSLEEMIDYERANQRDIFHFGMRFVVDGTDTSFIDKLLSNIINQEKDVDIKLLKNIQKEAVLGIQEGINRRGIVQILNSYVDNALAQAAWKNHENDYV